MLESMMKRGTMISKVNTQAVGQKKLPNILNSISFDIDSSINELSKILLYLSHGYKKDFPSSGGIEGCNAYTT